MSDALVMETVGSRETLKPEGFHSTVLLLGDERRDSLELFDAFSKNEIGVISVREPKEAYRELSRGRAQVVIVKVSQSALDLCTIVETIVAWRPEITIFLSYLSLKEEEVELLTTAGVSLFIRDGSNSVNELFARAREVIEEFRQEDAQRIQAHTNAEKACPIQSQLSYREAKDCALREFEEQYFAALLERTGGNVSEAARRAGLDRSNFRRALRRARVRADGETLEVSTRGPRPLARAESAASERADFRGGSETREFIADPGPKKWATGH